MYHRRHGLVSIVVTNYNNERYIEACLDSLRRQSYKNIELIVIDDCSSDNSRQVIRAWKKKYKHQLRHRIMVVNMPRNIGYAGAVTQGMYLAKGEFIAMQDGDDLSAHDRIEKQVNFLRSNRRFSLVGTNYRKFVHDTSKGTLPGWLCFDADVIKRRYAQGGHCISHGTILFRGALFDELGGPTRKLDGAEDYEMIAKCINAGYKVTNLREVLYYYRSHQKQRSRKYYRK